MIKNVFAKKETKGRKSNVYISDNLWRVVST